MITDGIETVLFCSREGQLMKKMFDDYQMIFFQKKLIKTEYFYVSRKATFLPTFKEFDNENFEILFRQIQQLKIGDFLSNIGFDNDEISSVCSDIETDVTEYITKDFNDELRKKLSNSQMFIRYYNKNGLRPCLTAPLHEIELAIITASVHGYDKPFALLPCSQE